jgi:sporulation integral membrane protein YlbJ
MKKIFIIVCIAAAMFFLFLYPENCLESARNGLNLWFSIVLPSLLPFMVASSILLETGIVRLLSFFFAPVTRVLFSAPGESAFVFLASALSGYPMGAKLAAQLYSKGQISEKDAQTIIRFTSVSGPLFITGAVSSGLLGSPESGIYLLSAHYLSAILTGIFFGLFSRKKIPPAERKSLKSALSEFKKDMYSCRPFGDLLADSVERSFFTLIKIGGLIITFSVVIEILSVSGVLSAAAWVYSPAAHLSGLTEGSIKSMIIGGVEMTSGCKAISDAALSLPQKLPVISSMIAFGGACIHMQTRSVCAASNLYPKRFLLAKSVQALLAYTMCSAILLIFPAGSAQTAPPDIKTAAYCGIAFIAIAFAALFIIKHLQKRKTVSI